MISLYIVICQLLFSVLKIVYAAAAMAKKIEADDRGGSWIFRDIPRDLMKRAKIAAAVEGKSIKALVLEALEEKIQELEKKGQLPKSVHPR
ncbi:MAG: hypothetical protein OJF50_001584 [Nitrospira sp.]|jgi:hypothetical protein|nr:hypothetical protein [Nitrospira sp.]